MPQYFNPLIFLNNGITHMVIRGVIVQCNSRWKKLDETKSWSLKGSLLVLNIWLASLIIIVGKCGCLYPLKMKDQVFQSFEKFHVFVNCSYFFLSTKIIYIESAHMIEIEMLLNELITMEKYKVPFDDYCRTRGIIHQMK